MKINLGQVSSPMGLVYYAVSSKGALAISALGQTREDFLGNLARLGIRENQCKPDKEGLHGVGEQLSKYLSGELRQFTFTLDYTGTPFQVQVWKALQGIPYGETRTYGDIARAIDNPKAVRAVGRANGANPLALAIPCHRVIAAGGGLGGFAGGLECKHFLLELERGASR